MENGEQLTFEFEQRPTIKGFPELRWTGKRPYRSTQYYPAQLRETYGKEQNGWINKIFWGDNPPGKNPADSPHSPFSGLLP